MISAIDFFRSKILKISLRVNSLRLLFFNRNYRVLFLFLTACSLYLVASLFFPLWVLLIGPILWGVPHLISSLRYTTNNFSEKQRAVILKFQITTWLVVFLYRYCVDVLQINLFWSQQTLLFESVCILISFFIQSYVQRHWNRENIFYFFVFMAILAATYFYPIQTALVALIGHNYLPLINWFKSCQNKSDRLVFYIASTVFVTCSFLIYFGTFTPIYKIISPSGNIGFLNWDYSEIINPFVSENFDYEFWFRIVSLYAFSQALHYFIWLKAIPENFQHQEHPPSFRWSFKMLSNEFGSGSLPILISLIALGIGLWFMYEFHIARLVYFCLASYHGFMEISAIPFLKSNLKLIQKK